MEKDSLGERDTDNNTNNFGRFSLVRTAKNRMMRCDRQGEITYNFISNIFTLCLKMLMISCSVDPTLVFEDLQYVYSTGHR